MKTRSKTSLAKVLAPEEIRPGQYVAVHTEIHEWFCVWCAAESFRPVAPIRWESIPEDPAQVYEVLGVCLPYVLVKPFRGRPRTLDVRRVRLARLSRSFANACRADAKDSDSGKQKRKKGRKSS